MYYLLNWNICFQSKGFPIKCDPHTNYGQQDPSKMGESRTKLHQSYLKLLDLCDIQDVYLIP